MIISYKPVGLLADRQLSPILLGARGPVLPLGFFLHSTCLSLINLSLILPLNQARIKDGLFWVALAFTLAFSLNNSVSHFGKGLSHVMLIYRISVWDESSFSKRPRKEETQATYWQFVKQIPPFVLTWVLKAWKPNRSLALTFPALYNSRGPNVSQAHLRLWQLLCRRRAFPRLWNIPFWLFFSCVWTRRSETVGRELSQGVMGPPDS